jgi:hypothetical protein
MNNARTRYVLRTRMSDESQWGPPEYFASRKERDAAAAQCRILGGIRTWSFDEKIEAAATADFQARVGSVLRGGTNG